MMEALDVYHQLNCCLARLLLLLKGLGLGYANCSIMTCQLVLALQPRL